MEHEPSPSKKLRGRRSAALILLVILLFQATATAAGTARPVPAILASSRTASTQVFAESWTLRRVFGYIQGVLNSQRRMVQFATIGLCIGLYILMRR